MKQSEHIDFENIVMRQDEDGRWREIRRFGPNKSDRSIFQFAKKFAKEFNCRVSVLAADEIQVTLVWSFNSDGSFATWRSIHAM